MSNSLKNLPEPFHYRNFHCLNEFVFEGSWSHEEAAANKPIGHNNHNGEGTDRIKPSKSLFQHYNTNNLLLADCEQGDIQVLCKNPVAYQEDIENCEPNRIGRQEPRRKDCQDLRAQTMQNWRAFPAEKLPCSEKNLGLSEQAKTNEFLFNFKKTAADKKLRKLKFLQDIEKKLDGLEQETKSIEGYQQHEQRELEGLLHIRKQIDRERDHDILVGKLDTAIHQSQEPKQALQKPRELSADMDYLEINTILDDQHQFNRNLIQMVATSDKSKSKQTQLQKGAKKSQGLGSTGFSKHSLGKTVKRHVQMPPKATSSKRLTSTSKDIKKWA